jgi:hypothetical protein
MTQPGSIRPPSKEDSSEKAERTSNDPFDALFNSLFAFPRLIYNRGNEHGRAFTRRYQDEHDHQEELQSAREGRRCSRWEGRHVRQCPLEEHLPATEDSASRSLIKPSVSPKLEKEVDDWMERIIEDLEKGEKEARQLYETWMTVPHEKPLQNGPAIQELHQVNNEIERAKSAQLPGDSEWVDIFPSWSVEAGCRWNEHGSRRHIFTKEAQNESPHKSAQDIDKTIKKLHQDIDRWLGDADQWRHRFQRGCERDSRLWQDEGLFGPSMPFSRPLSTLFSLGLRSFFPEQSAMGYLLYSEYSPLHLEHEEGFDSSFRQRFEDLLRAEDGKAMLSKEECSSASRTSSVDWLGRLVPLLKAGENGGRRQVTIGSASDNSSELQVQERKPSFDKPRDTRKSDGEPETEQDMYDQHLTNSSREPLEVSSIFRSTSQESPYPQPSILSTLTTTEHHVSPDGSVTTKTVLKRRFADGREENSETVETISATRPAWLEQRPDSSAETEAVERKPTLDEAPKKRGWFWSS